MLLLKYVKKKHRWYALSMMRFLPVIRPQALPRYLPIWVYPQRPETQSGTRALLDISSEMSDTAATFSHGRPLRQISLSIRKGKTIKTEINISTPTPTMPLYRLKNSKPFRLCWKINDMVCAEVCISCRSSIWAFFRAMCQSITIG